MTHLDDLTRTIRRKAGEVKALFNHVYDETRRAGLDFMAGIAVAQVREIASHDRSFSRLRRELEEGQDAESDNRDSTGSVFLVPDRWALEWSAIPEDPDVARFIREDTPGFVPPSYTVRSDEDAVEHLKGIAASEGTLYRSP